MINCFIYCDRVFLRTDSNKELFEMYENGNLKKDFTYSHHEIPEVNKITKTTIAPVILYYVKINECIFGNKEELMKKYPELFI